MLSNPCKQLPSARIVNAIGAVKIKVWGRHSPTSTTGQCAAISNFEIVATGRYLLIASSEVFLFQFFKMQSCPQSEGEIVNRSVSCLRGSPFAPNLRSCPCVAAALSGSPAFCAGSWRGIQIQTAHAIFKMRSMKNCRPVARLQILSENKENRPARDQRILSGTSGGKMVRCGCGAAVHYSKVVDMG